MEDIVCNNTLRLLSGRTYGVLIYMINQLIWMRVLVFNVLAQYGIWHALFNPLHGRFNSV